MSAAVFSYAWFSTKTITSENITGTTAGAYFASGDGTKTDKEDKSYILNKPIHLYNLAWLQYMGVFNEASSEKDSASDKYITKTTYFRLEDDLDMSGYVLPPIGTEEYPFVGNFDGNNHTVSNVTISSEFSDFTKHPNSVTNENYVTPNIIGFFGIIGKLDDAYKYVPNSETNSVYDLYLDRVIVENGSNSTSILAGLLAGYVNGTLTTSGVYRGKFDFASGTTCIGETINSSKLDKVSNYSLVGAFNTEDYSWEDQPGSEAGTSYGTSTNIEQLENDLDSLSSTYTDLKSGGTVQIPSGYAFPINRSSDALITDSTTKTFTVSLYGYGTSYRTKSLTSSKTFSAKEKRNIGYYAGDGLKFYTKNLDWNKDDFQVQSGSGYNTKNANLKKPTDDVLSYLQSDKGKYLLRLTSDLETNDLFNNNLYFSYVNDGTVNDYSGDIIFPSKCIWVAPKKAGTFKFAFYNEGGESDPCAINFFVLYRSTPKDYSSYFTYNSVASELSYYTKYGYFEREVSEYEVEAGVEFAIASGPSSNGKAPYIAYMDIGASGSGEEETNPAIITDVDFVAAKNDNISEGLIKIGDDGYTKSGILFSISGSGSSTDNQLFYFMRYVSSGVYYYYLSTNALSISVLKTDTGTANEDTDGSKSKWD